MLIIKLKFKKMKLRNLFLLIVLASFSLCVTAQTKTLITIHDKDCSHCRHLLNETYQDSLVKIQLAKYDHQIFEANTAEGIEMLKKYKVYAFPTQIVINKQKIATVRGYLTPQQQLLFLSNPVLFEASMKKKE